MFFSFCTSEKYPLLQIILVLKKWYTEVHSSRVLCLLYSEGNKLHWQKIAQCVGSFNYVVPPPNSKNSNYVIYTLKQKGKPKILIHLKDNNINVMEKKCILFSFLCFEILAKTKCFNEKTFLMGTYEYYLEKFYDSSQKSIKLQLQGNFNYFTIDQRSIQCPIWCFK